MCIVFQPDNRSYYMENETTEKQVCMYEKMIRTELAGNLCALKVIPIADSEHEMVNRYVELMKESDTRKFHSFKYIWTCLLYAKEFFTFKNQTVAIFAILFHKIGYAPGDKNSTRRTCEIALEFFPGHKSVELIRFIKAMQTEVSLKKRYGDERDFMADISNYFYGTVDYEGFKKIWAQILLEFQGAGYHPKKFKTFSRVRLNNMLRCAQVCGMYHTPQFFMQFNEQAICNMQKILTEI